MRNSAVSVMAVCTALAGGGTPGARGARTSTNARSNNRAARHTRGKAGHKSAVKRGKKRDRRRKARCSKRGKRLSRPAGRTDVRGTQAKGRPSAYDDVSFVAGESPEGENTDARVCACMDGGERAVDAHAGWVSRGHDTFTASRKRSIQRGGAAMKTCLVQDPAKKKHQKKLVLPPS